MANEAATHDNDNTSSCVLLMLWLQVAVEKDGVLVPGKGLLCKLECWHSFNTVFRFKDHTKNNCEQSFVFIKTQNKTKQNQHKNKSKRKIRHTKQTK